MANALDTTEFDGKTSQSIWQPSPSSFPHIVEKSSQTNVDSIISVKSRPANISPTFCTAPAGLCQVIASETEVYSTTTRVHCANPDCTHGGQIHLKCLQTWMLCCETQCHAFVQYSSISSSTTSEDISKAFTANLCNLYRCPRCHQPSLNRINLDDSGICVPNRDDVFYNLSSAVQYTGERLQRPRSPVSSSPHDRLNYFCSAADQVTPTECSPLHWSSAKSASMSYPCTPLEEPNARLKRASWHTDGTSMSANVYQKQAQQLPPYNRRLSFRQKNSVGSLSSGYHSGFSTNTQPSEEASRRCSQNLWSSDLNDSASPFSPCGGSGIGDDGFWSLSHGPRIIRGAGSTSSTLSRQSPLAGGSKAEAFFTFDPLPELPSDSPTPTPLSGDETDMQQNVLFYSAKPTSSYNRCLTPVRARTISSSSPSFWPSCPTNEAHKVVVNRRGNVFQTRSDFHVFQELPSYKQNPYFIQMDDDSCTGNEDTRAFILAQLTHHRVPQLNCLNCQQVMTIFDHFPIVDGLLFLSPICHQSAGKSGPHADGYGLRVTWQTHAILPSSTSIDMEGANADPVGPNMSIHSYDTKLLEESRPLFPPPGCLGPRQQVSGSHQTSADAAAPSRRLNCRQYRYLHALCMNCLHPTATSTDRDTSAIRCRSCDQSWNGANFTVGGLYTYDIFAASPCCVVHLRCNACGHQLDQEPLKSIGHKTLSAPPCQESPCSDQDGPSSPLSSSQPQQIRLPLHFFSQYSQLIKCPYCSNIDYHFVKPFDKHYYRTVN